MKVHLTSVPVGLVFWLSLDGQRRTDLFRSPSVTIWPCHLHDQWSDSVAVFQAHARNMGQLRTQHVTLWALLCPTRVVSHLDHLHLSPDGGLSPKSVISSMMVRTIALQWALHLCLMSIVLPLHSPMVVAQIPQLTDGALLQTTPALGDSPGGHDPCPVGPSAVRYSFIQIGMNLALFIPKIFIQNHFHPKTTFIQNHFHPKTTFIPKPLSSQTTVIQNHFHPKPLSSKTTFIP